MLQKIEMNMLPKPGRTMMSPILSFLHESQLRQHADYVDAPTLAFDVTLGAARIWRDFRRSWRSKN